MKKITIIAEIGINHNGDMTLTKKMIDEAKNCGVDFVKFQKRNINTVYSEKILSTERESPWGNTTRQQKEGLEFSENDYNEINEYCKKIDVGWFASAWDLKSLEFLKKYNCKYNKIASAMIVDKHLLKAVAEEKKHTFISTGMSTLQNIDEAVKIFQDINCSFELMHCISAYPFDEMQTSANLNLINFFKDRYKCDVGYSGHEKGGLAISFAAAGIGITSLERHFTTDRSLYGSDQAASLEPRGFRDLVNGIRKIENALQGANEKIILDEEKKVAEKLRAHINYEKQ